MGNFPLEGELHSEVVRARTGKEIHAEVLKSVPKGVRAIYMCDDSGKAIGGFAITIHRNISIGLSKINQEIDHGGLIGETFKKHGYEVSKNVLHVEVIKLPDILKARFGLNHEHAKMRISEFIAQRPKDERLVYATIMEIYHPEMVLPEIDENDLRQISNPTWSIKQGVGKPAKYTGAVKEHFLQLLRMITRQ